MASPTGALVAGKIQTAGMPALMRPPFHPFTRAAGLQHGRTPAVAPLIAASVQRLPVARSAPRAGALVKPSPALASSTSRPFTATPKRRRRAWHTASAVVSPVRALPPRRHASDTSRAETTNVPVRLMVLIGMARPLRPAGDRRPLTDSHRVTSPTSGDSRPPESRRPYAFRPSATE